MKSLEDFRVEKAFSLEKYALDMDYDSFLRFVSECCETSRRTGRVPREQEVEVEYLTVEQSEKKDAVILDYDLCQKDDDKYLFSVGIILYCSREEQERFLSQSHEDILAVLSALENGLATDEPRSTKAMRVFASHQVPASSSLFPKLSEVAVS